MIRAIAALDERRGIGLHGRTPWHIPEELRYFKQQTEHHIVLMGSILYQEFSHPLVNRRNVVASRSLTEVRDGFELTTDVVDFLRHITDDVWIIGGASLYATTLDFCDELYITQISGDFGCDRFFPEYADDFALSEQSAPKLQDDYQYTFTVFERSKNR